MNAIERSRGARKSLRSRSRSKSRSKRLGRKDSKSLKGRDRPALQALPTGGVTPTSGGALNNVVNTMRGYSAVSDNPFFENKSEFELMHIKITVFALSGILVDHKNGDAPVASDSTKNSSLTTGSSLSSVDGSAMMLMNMSSGDQENKTPIHAVVTHNRNVGNNATSISSHLPSMPFGQPISTFGNVARHMAIWPAHESSILLQNDEDCSLMDQSSFIMERVMMREPYDRARHRSRAEVPGFVHETIDLAINLKRGGEIIPLGLSSLVITGDEEGPIRMNLPAKAIRFKGKKMVIGKMDLATESLKGKKGRRIFSKSVENSTFPSDKSKEYCLEENATLKIALQVIPHSSIRATEASKVRQAHKERRRQERLMRVGYANYEDYRREVQERLHGMNSNTPRTKKTDNTSEAGRSTKMTALGICSHMMCFGDTDENVRGRGDYKMDNDKVQNYLREHGVSFDSSILSSVSESESESESEDERGADLLHSQIVVRKRAPLLLAGQREIPVDRNTTKASF